MKNKMTSENEDGFIWGFGYGSNMDVKSLEENKKVKVLDSCPAILRNHRLAFNMRGIPLMEPAFANVEEKEGEEVHGIAFCMTTEDAEKLNRFECVYDTKTVTLESYDGRSLKGYIFVSRDKPEGEWAPSKRYLGLLCKGARKAGLRQSYIDKLSLTPTYKPDDWILRMRSSRPDCHTLPEITLAQLVEHVNKPNDVWVSCLGYVVKRSWTFEDEDEDSSSVRRLMGFHMGSLAGRDITGRGLLHFRGGMSLQDHDDAGKPQYPLVKDLGLDELEYVTCMLDCLQASVGCEDWTEDGNNVLEFVGFLKEFKDQQDSGKTTFALPELPKQ